MKLLDLTIPLGAATPPWPTYEPLQLQYFKQLVLNGANGQVPTDCSHLGTHLDSRLCERTGGQPKSAEPLVVGGIGSTVDHSDEVKRCFLRSFRFTSKH